MTPEQIRASRKNLGLSQAKLSTRIGVTQTTISNWESGKTSPSAAQVTALQKELGEGKAKASKVATAPDAYGEWLSNVRIEQSLSRSEGMHVSGQRVGGLELAAITAFEVPPRTRLQRFKKIVLQDVDPTLSTSASLCRIGRMAVGTTQTNSMAFRPQDLPLEDVVARIHVVAGNNSTNRHSALAGAGSRTQDNRHPGWLGDVDGLGRRNDLLVTYQERPPGRGPAQAA